MIRQVLFGALTREHLFILIERMDCMSLYYVIVMFALLTMAPNFAYCQGSAVIMPMSSHVVGQDQKMTFQIYNQLESVLSMDIQMLCEVDGVTLKGLDCSKYFRLKLGDKINPTRIDIAKTGSVAGEVEFSEVPQKYGLIKPIFTPIRSGESKFNSVAFEFSYQPGYLFLVNSETATLEKPVFSTRVIKDEKVAIFEFNPSSLSMPAVASISAKISAIESKKTIRFARLASEKIIDPKRKKLVLETSYTSAKDDTPTCYDLIIQWVSSKSIQKISDCPL